MFIYLLDSLSSEYPSQRTFLPAFRDASEHHHIPQKMALFLQRLSTALRRSDFLLVFSLTRSDSSLMTSALNPQYRPPNPSPLFADALDTLLERIRTRARDSAWIMLRTAYREADTSASGAWLLRWLQLPAHDLKSGSTDSLLELTRWFEGRTSTGEVEKLMRDGEPVKGRWTLRRPAIA